MTDSRLDLDALRMIIRNPHAYPLAMITEGLELAINELENARTTIAEDLEYQRKLEHGEPTYAGVDSVAMAFTMRAVERLKSGYNNTEGLD